jgi:hypothetical protein
LAAEWSSKRQSADRNTNDFAGAKAMSIFELTLVETDHARANSLREVFSGNRKIDIREAEAVRWLQPPSGLDVIYLPLAAAERWGSVPKIHESQVLATREDDQLRGMPPFVVTGVCMAPDDPRGPIPETGLLIRSVFEAIRKFNSSGRGSLTKIGFWAENLTKGVSAQELRKLLYDTVPELHPVS